MAKLSKTNAPKFISKVLRTMKNALSTKLGRAVSLFSQRLLAAALICITTHASARNIFDFDDPPSATKPADPSNSLPETGTRVTPVDIVAPKEAEKPVEATKPNTSGPVSKPISTPTVPTGGMRSIPSKADLERSSKLLKEAFTQQLADKTLPARRNLAAILLQEAGKASDNPSDQYTLLFGAVNAAREAASLRLVISAADETAKIYAVAPLQMKIKAALNMPLKADTASNTIDNVLSGLELIDGCVASEDYVTANKLCNLLRPPSAADPALMAIVQKRQQDLELLIKAQERIALQIEKLETVPDDAAANQAVGAFQCFFLEKWDIGLPMLSIGSDADLKKLASEEIAAKDTADIDVLTKLGDSWWAVAAKQQAAVQAKIRKHALAYYSRCEGKLSPLQRIKIDKRFAEVGSIGNGQENALAEIRMKQRLTLFNEMIGLLDAKPPKGRIAYPMIKTPLDGDVVLPAVKGGYALKGTVDIGWCGNNHGGKWLAAHLKPSPSVCIEGGTLLTQNGTLELIGERNSPIILRNVHVGCEYTGNIKARYVIFEKCVFTKDGAYHWNDGPSAKLELTDCLVIDGDFKSLKFFDTGIKWNHCSFVGSKFSDRTGKTGPNEDSQRYISSEWSHVANCDFFSCYMGTSLFALPDHCNFFHCKLGETQYYRSSKPLEIEIGLPVDDPAKFLAELASKTLSPGTAKLTFSAAPAQYKNEAFPNNAE